MRLLTEFKLCHFHVYLIIFHSLGGWASGSCPHMVVYCLKFVLRGESPRDYADLLRSLKFPPSISICDIPERLASHVNNSVPGFFSPHYGRLFPITESNLAAAEQGVLEKSLPWIHNEGAPSFPSAESLTVNRETEESELVHPTTKVPDRYCLSDRFHETNSSQRRALLWRVTLVPELNGIVNTEAEEQLHNIIGRSNYCLNTMKPVNHLFMMRLKIQLHNTGINSAFREKIESTFSAQAGRAVKTDLDNHGRLLLRQRNTQSRTSPTHNPSLSSPAVTPASAGTQFDEPEPPMSPIIPVYASKSKNEHGSSTSIGSWKKDPPNREPSFQPALPVTEQTKRAPGMSSYSPREKQVRSVSPP